MLASINQVSKSIILSYVSPLMIWKLEKPLSYGTIPTSSPVINMKRHDAVTLIAVRFVRDSNDIGGRAE